MWPRAKLKFVARLGYGDALPSDEPLEGAFRVFGSNGPFASLSRANTRKPAIIIGRKGSYGKVNWTAEPCFASDTTFFVDESTSRNHLRWVYWLLQTLRLDEGTDEAAVPGLNRETAYNREVLVPTLSEQCAIANYLDRETARLDTLVTAKEHLLDLIAEKRRALITRAVTRGVGAMGWQSLQTHPDPAARGNERGIEEGGGEDHAVSAGGDGVMWPRAKLKFVARLGYGDALPSDEPLEGAFRVFGSNGPFASLSRANTRKPAIIIGRKGSYGKVNWTAEPCFASDTTFFVDESTSRNHLRWVYWLLQTLRLDEGTDEAAVPGLNRETAYNREVLVPTLSEQCAIANYLDRETARLDTLSSMTEETIALLKERRAAVIAAAVTGRIDMKEKE